MRSWANAPGAQRDALRRGLYLGRNLDTARGVRLAPGSLPKHVNLIGPPGGGKTRLLHWIFRSLCLAAPQVPVILFNVKGSLGRDARDWALQNGFGDRLIWFDPGNKARVVGWNPLAPNGLPAVVQAKLARSAFLAGWGQSDFVLTPQLDRILLWALYAARELCLTPAESLQLLLPNSGAREVMVPALTNPLLRQVLEEFMSLPLRRQEELAASTVARLEAFLIDPTIRRILCQERHRLDLGAVIRDRKILIVNIEENRPLTPDDTELLGRAMINDIVGHVFSREHGDPPIFLMIDEAHRLLTADLGRCLELGRELGLGVVIAHQFLDQFLERDLQGKLRKAVLNCCRTRIVFPGLSYEDLQQLGPELFLDEFDPKSVKDEIVGLELEPVESRRTVRSAGTTWSSSYGGSLSLPVTRNHGTSEQAGDSLAETDTESETTSSGHARGRNRMAGSSEGIGFGSTSGVSMPSGPGAEAISHASMSQQAFSGSFVGSGEGESDFEGHALARGRATTRGSHRARGTNSGTSIGVVPTLQATRSHGGSETTQEVPFYENIKRWRTTSREFWRSDEFLLQKEQRLRGLPVGHAVVKVPGKPAVFLRCPWVATTALHPTTLVAKLARVYEQDCYALPEEVAKEEATLADRLVRLLPGTTSGADEDFFEG